MCGGRACRLLRSILTSNMAHMGHEPQPRQQHAFLPAQPEVFPPKPVLAGCTLRRMMIAADNPDGTPEPHDVVVADESGLTFMFVRSLKDAIYGQVWDALEVRLHSGGGVIFYTPVLDERGVPRRFAVKRMPKETIDRLLPTMQENPMREAAFLTLVQDPGHPNVVGLAAALQDDATVYLVTPFVGGVGSGEMFDWVADNYQNPAPEATIMPLLHQIVDGTRYVHSKGICHADMSLENTLVNSAHTESFIIDFGMALQMPIDEAGQRFMSVPDRRKAKRSYCPPETYKGRDPYDGVKVDVFSVGCMGFMMFTGIPPFDYASRLDRKFRKVVFEGDLQGYLAEYGMPLLPDPVFRLLQGMMSYKPELRPLPVEVLENPWFAPLGYAQQPQAAAPAINA
ncbi:unnamed protein product [Ectocarpus sp. 4 AP-2014]